MDDREVDLAYSFIKNFHKLSPEFLAGTMWEDLYEWSKHNHTTSKIKYELALCKRMDELLETKEHITLHRKFNRSNGSHTS